MLKIGVAVSLKAIAKMIHEMLMGYAEIIFFDTPEQLISHLNNENLNLLIIDKTFKNKPANEILDNLQTYPALILLTSDTIKDSDFNAELVLRRPFSVYELREAVNFTLTDRIYNRTFSNKIMIVDDSNVTRNILKQELTILGFNIIEADSGKKALEMLQSPENTPFLFIIDQEMPQMNGIDLAREIRNLNLLHDIPIIMFTGLYNNLQLRKEAFNVGINDFIPKPFKKEIFKAIINKYTLLSANNNFDSKIIILTSQLSKSKAISSILKSYGFKVFSTDNCKKFLNLTEDNDFSLAIVDLKNIEAANDDFFHILRKNQPEGFPVIAYLPVEDFQLKEKLFKTFKENISDYILEPFDTDELLFIVETWLKQYKLINEYILQKNQLEKLTTFDLLTGVYNRFAILKIGEEQFSLSLRNSSSFSILYLDIDYFKKVNDIYGHDVGDMVLKVFSKTISDNLRLEDKIGRLGGEEFLVILPFSNRETSKTVAEKLKNAIENIVFENYPDLKITTSIGLATFNAEKDKEIKTFDQLITLADNLLYKAKESGRNKIITN